MWLLLACAPPTPTPTLPLPPATPAEHADAVDVDRLLTPTPLAASSPETLDLLCPWARGEPVADASIAQWLTVGWLTWRVYDAATDTFVGRPITREWAVSMTDAVDALDARCGSKLARLVLIAAGPEADYRPVDLAIMRLSGAPTESFWLLVDDPTPTPPSPRSVEPGFAPEHYVTITMDEPISATGYDDAPIGGLAEALTLRPKCAGVWIMRHGSVGAALRVADALRGVGAYPVLQYRGFGMDKPAATPVVAGPARVGTLHGQLSAFRVGAPMYDGGEGCVRPQPRRSLLLPDEEEPVPEITPAPPTPPTPPHDPAPGESRAR